MDRERRGTVTLVRPKDTHGRVFSYVINRYGSKVGNYVNYEYESNGKDLTYTLNLISYLIKVKRYSLVYGSTIKRD